MSIYMYWPIALIVLSNLFYHVCSKSTPANINPFASLTITYTVGALVSGLLYFTLNKGGNLLQEYRNVNWSVFVFGLALVGLEVGSIYMYKLGWNISTGQLVYSSILSILLIGVGYFFYGEAVTWNKLLGVLVCIVGLILINK